jgi:hypothetical protein
VFLEEELQSPVITQNRTVTTSFNRTVSYQNRTWGAGDSKPVHWVDRSYHWSSLSSSNATRGYDADIDGTTIAPDDDNEIWIPPPGNYYIPDEDVSHPWSFYGIRWTLRKFCFFRVSFSSINGVGFRLCLCLYLSLFLITFHLFSFSLINGVGHCFLVLNHLSSH